MFILGPHTREVDFSLYVSSVSKVSVGIVGTSTRGEIGVPTFISNQTEFANKFGDQFPDCLATYSAMQYLSEGNQLWFSRVAGDSVAKSKAVSKGELDVEVIEFEGITPGTDYDGIRIKISNVQLETPFAFDVTVIDKTGRAVESFPGVNTDSTSPLFVDKVLATKSREISSTFKLASPSAIKAEVLTLSGGSNGIDDINSSDYIGAPTKNVGLYSMKPSYVNINVMLVPGNSAPEVVSAMLNFAEERGDVLSIPDPPLGLSVQEVTDWHNGAGEFTSHQAFNSSYGALYWSWQEIYDSPNDMKVWIPPSGLVAAAFAYSSAVSEIWYAPAGLKRGLLNTVLRSEHNPDPGEQGLLYGTSGNNVNPIIKHPQAGIAIFGQKTLQRMPSATDRVNVRLLLNHLKKIISGTAAYLAFDPNDRVTWNEFEDMVEPVLRDIKIKRGLYDYKIQMNEQTVTANDIDGYAMPGKIFVKPTKAAESIPIDFIITRSGAEFLSYDISI